MDHLASHRAVSVAAEVAATRGGAAATADLDLAGHRLALARIEFVRQQREKLPATLDVQSLTNSHCTLTSIP